MGRLSVKRQLGRIWPANTKNRKIILLYHSVGESSWAMNEDIFLEQINWLHENHQILPLTQLIESKPSDKIQISLTFDDGYKTLYDHVFPILLQKKINATVYINTGWISEDAKDRKKSCPELGHYPEEYFLTWHEVKHLSKNYWEIGSHGINHDNFQKMKEDIIERELMQSKIEIEKKISKKCLHFSYPFGLYSNRVKNKVKEASYQYATAARHGRLLPGSDHLALPRINVSKDYSLDDFKNIVSGKWDYLGWAQKIKGL